MTIHAGLAEAMEWFVKNVIGKAAELFLDLLRLSWKATGVLIDFLDIGFWPSLALISISSALWLGIDYYNLTIQKNNLKPGEFQKKMTRYRRSVLVLAIFAAFFLYSFYLETGLYIANMYFLASMFYLVVFIRVIYFIFNLRDERNPKCE